MTATPIPAGSKVYWNADVTVPSYVTNITDDAISAAIIPVGQRDPLQTDWKSTGVRWHPTKLATAQVLVGPGTSFDFSSAPGVYLLYFLITDDPEVPELRSGFITFT